MANRILVVDDSATYRSIIAVTLQQAGKDVAVACDGLEGLEALQEASFDLFIVDINMPRMGGVEFICKMREQARFSDVPVVVLAAEDEAEEHAELESVHPLYWLEKGFSPAELVTEVNNILS